MTQRIGLIGFPLGHSISPVFQQAALDARGIDARYEPWEIPPERVEEIATRLRASETLGANVTIPYKSAVLSFLDEIDPAARAVGAVNTILHDGDRLIGSNTDVVGFTRSIREDAGREIAGAILLVVGAGGAARAVVAAGLREGAARIVVVARRPSQAEALAAEFQRGPLASDRTAIDALPLDPRDPRLGDAVAGCDLLVNATPVGMGHGADAPPPISLDRLSPRALVCDLIYRPPRTALLREAQERGAAILNGLPMLIYQGAASFERWTGQAAPVEIMRRAAEEALRGE